MWFWLVLAWLSAALSPPAAAVLVDDGQGGLSGQPPPPQAQPEGTEPGVTPCDPRVTVCPEPPELTEEDYREGIVGAIERQIRSLRTSPNWSPDDKRWDNILASLTPGEVLRLSKLIPYLPKRFVESALRSQGQGQEQPTVPQGNPITEPPRTDQPLATVPSPPPGNAPRTGAGPPGPSPRGSTTRGSSGSGSGGSRGGDSPDHQGPEGAAPAGPGPGARGMDGDRLADFGKKLSNFGEQVGGHFGPQKPDEDLPGAGPGAPPQRAGGTRRAGPGGRDQLAAPGHAPYAPTRAGDRAARLPAPVTYASGETRGFPGSSQGPGRGHDQWGGAAAPHVAGPSHSASGSGAAAAAPGGFHAFRPGERAPAAAKEPAEPKPLLEGKELSAEDLKELGELQKMLDGVVANRFLDKKALASKLDAMDEAAAKRLGPNSQAIKEFRDRLRDVMRRAGGKLNKEDALKLINLARQLGLSRDQTIRLVLAARNENPPAPPTPAAESLWERMLRWLRQGADWLRTRLG